jgi:hypothetical protein
MYNRKVLIDALKKLGSAKAPSNKKNIIVDPDGQWAHPGEITRIPSNTITMSGVPYPVLGKPNVGEPQMMYPGQNYQFPDADYVDEFPMQQDNKYKDGGETLKKFVSAKEGVDTPIYKQVSVKKSKIAGKGLFTNEPVKMGEPIGISHIRKVIKKDGELYQAPFPSTVLGYYNHSEEPNVKEVDNGDHIVIVALRDIKPNEELTSNYDVSGISDLETSANFKKGGSTPRLPKKNNPRSYSRSLEATNRLLAEHPFFAKPKSRKNKIYDPNAKYFQDGGIMSQEEIDDANTTMMKARLAYADMHGNPAAKRMIVAPDQPYQFENGDTGTHFMASMGEYAVPQIQNVNGQLMLGDYDPRSAEAFRFDNPADAQYFAAENYKRISPAFLNSKKQGGEYIELKLTPKEIEEYKKGGYIIEDISVPSLNQMEEGGDPGDVQCPPGYVYNPETKYCEKKSGCPEGYTFDAKSGRCVSKYEKESVKVYTGPYKYGPDGRKITDPTRYDISELRETTPDELITATQREQQLYPEDNFNWPSDYTIKEIFNPVYFLPSQTNWIDVNGTSHPFDVYPDLNYKVVVDPKKPEGFNKDENIYYVKSENTHQFKKYKEWELLKKDEKKIIEDAQKRGYTIKQGKPDERTVLPYDNYKKYVTKKDIDPNTGEVYEYESEEFLPGWDEKSFAAQNKSVSELYQDPEYLGYEAYNKSFDEVYKDRPQLNKQQWSEQCPDCTYNHGYAFQVDPDYVYRSYNPNQNKVGPTGSINRVIKTLENEYADPNMVQQMPTIEEYPYPDGPGYNPVGYKGIGIHPTWGYDKKSKTHIGLHPGKRNSGEGRFYKYDTWEDDRDFRGFGQHDRTKLLPFIVQKSTGYNPQQMEGYYNEEGDWVPGEYERAQEEGRKINFQGAASLKDLRNQKDYQLKYAQYLKEKDDIDKMNKELRQQWLPEQEVAGQYAKGGFLSKANMGLIVPKAGQLARTGIYKGINPAGYSILDKVKGVPSELFNSAVNNSNRPFRVGMSLKYGQPSHLNNLLVSQNVSLKDFKRMSDADKMQMFDSSTLNKLQDVGRRRLDAWAVGLGLPQEYSTLQQIGDNKFRMLNTEYTPMHFNELYNDLRALGYENTLTAGHNPLEDLSRELYTTKLQLEPKYSDPWELNLRMKFEDSIRPFGWNSWERSRNAQLKPKSFSGIDTGSVWDNDAYGVMGGFRWDIDNNDKGLQFTTSDVWDLNPFEKRGSAYLNLNPDTKKALEASFFKPLQNVEALKLVGGKPFLIENNFIVDPKTYKTLDSYQEGGDIDYELGDEVDEATMKALEKLGYTFEKI